jgi:aspartate kinase
MAILVQKFGGTSVADAQKILAAARRAIRARNEGYQVVMVVSAMGHTTDELIALAKQITDQPPARELDMLLATGEQVSVALMAMAINSLGYDAISLAGPQLGILTDSTFTKARIRSISTERIRQLLEEGKIVIAAGFQGVDPSFNITTLGRGGSDTTAVALAAALQADFCEIYTDVDGVYTTDPRIVPEARQLARISYDEMLELASAGAAVMHNRSIEFAKRFGVPVHVRSSFSDRPGTLITSEPESRQRPVCGAALAKNEARVTVLGVPDRPGMVHAIFSKVAARNVAMDMIVQNLAADGRADVSFTVPRDELPLALKAAEEAARELGAEGTSYEDDVAKVSVVGMGMVTQPGVAQRMFAVLAEHGINIEMISTSQIKISVVVERQYGVEALRAVHQAFNLHEPVVPDELPAGVKPRPILTPEILERLQGLEDLVIEDISLDATQSRVTITDIPDRPGLAARLFQQVAQAGVNVDMIVQSVGRDGRATITFTVPREALEQCLRVSQAFSQEIGAAPPVGAWNVAKLMVFGTGMRSHSDVARRSFKALAERGINVEMISTSEVCLNIVVDGNRGQEALEALEKEFANVRL